MPEVSLKDRPIGVFDSGIGGLTVVRRLMEHLPAEQIVYFGDSARVPYGTKSPETVTRFSVENARFLIRRGIKFLVVACNTASSVAMPELRRRFDLPMTGVIEPGVAAAVAATRNGKIGVIGTSATIASGSYERMIREADSTCGVTVAACPLFVPLAEEGWTGGSVVEQIAHLYLDPLLGSGIDTLILGCTHYPLLKETIASVAGEAVTLIDTADETVGLVRRMLEDHDILRDPAGGSGERRFFVSDVPAQFNQVGSRFLGCPFLDIERVDQGDLPWYER